MARDKTERSAAGINYLRRGSGEPVLLMHGIGGEHCVWEPVLESLSANLDVIAVDLPGFGRSDPLPAGDEPTPPRLARAVAGLLGELGLERAHVCGNSLGGWIALELAKAGRADSVTALCPAGLWGAPIRRARAPETQGRLNRFARMIRPLLPLLMLSGRARRLALGHVVAHPDRVPRSAARRMVSSYARATAYDATNNAMLSSNFTGAEAIKVPVTVAFGERDRLIRPSRLRAAGSRSVLLPDCGHIPMWDAPDLVSQLILSTAESAAGGPRIAELAT